MEPHPPTMAGPWSTGMTLGSNPPRITINFFDLWHTNLFITIDSLWLWITVHCDSLFFFISSSLWIYWIWMSSVPDDLQHSPRSPFSFARARVHGADSGWSEVDHCDHGFVWNSSTHYTIWFLIHPHSSSFHPLVNPNSLYVPFPCSRAISSDPNAVTRCFSESISPGTPWAHPPVMSGPFLVDPEQAFPQALQRVLVERTQRPQQRHRRRFLVARNRLRWFQVASWWWVLSNFMRKTTAVNDGFE